MKEREMSAQEPNKEMGKGPDVGAISDAEVLRKKAGRTRGNDE